MTFAIEVKTKTQTAEETRGLGLIPAVLYGQEDGAISVAVDKLAFEKLYGEAGESSLVDLSVAGGKGAVKVLIQDIQRDPVKGDITHVDFMRINMNKEMHATLPINFVGESLAVKELGGTLIKSLQELDIKCLPKDLVSHIDMDLSVLKTFDDIVHIKELVVPAGITIMENPETVVAKVAAPLTEEQLKAMEESGVAKAVADIEVAGAKKEGEDGEVVAEEGVVKEDSKKEAGKKEGNKKE